MSYMIDGHNLIPKIPGLSLSALEDEQQLIEQLQEFCRREGKSVEVYFDRAAPGQSGRRRYGKVTAHFVQQGLTADQAIHNRLRRLGKVAPNWTVVSSDLAVQNAARQARARVISSEAFARVLLGRARQKPPGKAADLSLDAAQVDEWLDLFGSDDNGED